MITHEEVIYEAKEKIARITINRPERRNALNSNVINLLAKDFDIADSSRDISVVILSGAGGHFCAGADLGGSFSGEQSFLEMHESRGDFARLLMRMNKCKKPIIAAVEGYCLAGGVGLCLSSDIVIATEDSQFGLPEIRRGLWPYMVTAVLIRNLGRKKALELCMTGERISGKEAQQMGMINYAVPKEEFSSKVDEMANRLASMSPAIMALGKSSFYQIADMEFSSALEFLKSQITINTQCEDLMEGIRAFMEKREPRWKGR